MTIEELIISTVMNSQPFLAKTDLDGVKVIVTSTINIESHTCTLATGNFP